MIYFQIFSASQLRCIWLDGCSAISNEVFEEIAKRQPFLEELDICHCSFLSKDLFEHIGRCCPLLKSLKYSPPNEVAGDNKCDDVAFAIANTMSNLRHLTVLNNELTNNGLLAILDGCPLLESLDIRGCVYVELDGSLGKRCNEQIKVLRFPAESIDHKFDRYDYTDYIYHGFMTCNIKDVGNIDLSWIDGIPESDVSDFDFY
ncbi:putative F-box/LRR-repeat protein 23 [Vicia villosa]|uniref:putative F-box/LRR-repeat protein 23 n=1 Tax=Vicia villosa TaxID=3911 RepID=UPI00273B9CD9|nr:putative F-box/LRR-repeat protein 23 [Vicia villosa]